MLTCACRCCFLVSRVVKTSSGNSQRRMTQVREIDLRRTRLCPLAQLERRRSSESYRRHSSTTGHRMLGHCLARLEGASRRNSNNQSAVQSILHRCTSNGPPYTSFPSTSHENSPATTPKRRPYILPDSTSIQNTEPYKPPPIPAISPQPSPSPCKHTHQAPPPSGAAFATPLSPAPCLAPTPGPVSIYVVISALLLPVYCSSRKSLIVSNAIPHQGHVHQRRKNHCVLLLPLLLFLSVSAVGGCLTTS